MIKYKLKCDNNHFFNSWFSSSKDYERLRKKNLLNCPECNSLNVKKSIMSPNLSHTVYKNKKKEKFQKELKSKIRQLQSYIEKNCDYVGDNFTREARNMHYDDKKSRGIYGKASSAEVKELVEEGIEISSIPWIDKKEH